MSTIYDATVLLAIGLLAIVVAIFVFGVSLLGRALEAAKKEEEDRLIKRGEELDDDVERLKKDLDKLKPSGSTTTLERKLKEVEKKRKDSERELKRIRAVPRLLTLKESVAIPSISLLASLSFGGAAKLVADGWLFYLLWVLSLLALAWGVYRIYQTLKVIEKVAVTSEEAYFARTKEAFKAALEQHEETKRPLLALRWTDKKPPFAIKAGSEGELPFILELIRGDIGKGAEVWFFAPPGFTFPKEPTVVQREDFIIPRALTARKTLGDIRPRFDYPLSIVIKAPSKTGEFKLLYRLQCGGFVGEYRVLEVKVE